MGDKAHHWNLRQEAEQRERFVRDSWNQYNETGRRNAEAVGSGIPQPPPPTRQPEQVLINQSSSYYNINRAKSGLRFKYYRNLLVICAVVIFVILFLIPALLKYLLPNAQREAAAIAAAGCKIWDEPTPWHTMVHRNSCDPISMRSLGDAAAVKKH